MKCLTKYFVTIIIVLGGICFGPSPLLFMNKASASTVDYTFPTSVVKYLNSLQIPHDVYVELVRCLTLGNEIQSNKVGAKQVKILQAFYEKTKSKLEKAPPVSALQSQKGTKITVVHYHQLLGNQMNAVRALCYYVDYDIAKNDKIAALEHFLLINQLAEVRLGEGEKLIYWRILANVTTEFQLLLDKFTFTDKELSLLAREWKTLLSKRQNRLLQPGDNYLFEQIEQQILKNQEERKWFRQEKDSFFSNQKQALIRAECAYVGICALRYRREIKHWPSTIQDLIPRFLQKTDSIWAKKIKMKPVKNYFEIYSDTNQEKPNFIILAK